MPLAAAPALLAAPPLVGAALLVLLLFAWLALRPSRRESFIAAPLLALAAILLAIAGVAQGLPVTPRAEWAQQAQQRYRALWVDIAGHARDGARVIGLPPTDAAGRLAAHRRLAALLAGAHPDLTFLLVDPDGQPVVWEGRGLLHEPRPEELPRQGFDFRAAFGAATLMAVAPLAPDARPWRVVAGRSFETSRLPFDAPGWLRSTAYPWALVGRPEAATAGAVVLSAPEAPWMAVQPQPRGGLPGNELAWTGAAAAVAVALALLFIAAMRAVALAVLWRTTVPFTHGPAAVALLGVAGAVAAGMAGGAPGWALGALVVGLAVAAAGWRLGRSPRRGVLTALAGGAVAAALALASAALQRWLAPLPLTDLVGGAAATALRAALLAAAMGSLWLAGGTAAAARPARGRLALLAAGLLLLAASAHDRATVALPLLVAGGAAAAVWVSRSGWRQRPATLVPLVLLAALLGATAWELAYRYELSRAVADRYLPAMAPPSRVELRRSWAEVERYFATTDLARLVPRTPDGLLPTDLAYLLWRGSPLDRADASTALVVVPHGSEPVAFSYGLPLTEAGALDRNPVRWGPLGPPAWSDLLLAGEVPLHAGGRRWGVARLWLLPQPGFRLHARRAEALPVGLLRGGPAAHGPTALPPGVRYALYAQSGAAQTSPWRESPPLPSELRTQRRALVSTPEGEAWGFTRRDRDGIEALYLPVLRPTDGMEAVGSLGIAMLLLAVAAATLGALLALTRASFRDVVRRAVRSYSKRLLLVYGLLLLVPLAALNVLLLRNLEQRLLAEQRAAGEAAVRSAQQVLGEYVLSLEPGFGLDTALDDELLVWLSRVLHHEVNLYWGSSINASSKRELFSAGLLPERIPGDIYARLVLLQNDLAWRTSRAGDLRYLELYAPLRIPAAGEGEPRLFLSMPLLAQQQELASELAELRRRALLLTAAIFLVAAALGSRLARTFTRPIQELVEGTRRIAAGATALDLTPSEQELAALVAAIDEMARRIAEGRQRIVREKQVIERMVENITSGVVSVDEGGRVLLANRAAGQLLGTQVGDPLRLSLSRQEALAPVARFLAEVRAEPAEITVRLQREGEEREYRLAWVPVPGAGEPSALLVIEDATEVLRSQRLQAWAEMARIIAHEIKNPLTPIRLSTEHMVEVHQRDPERFDEVFDRCTTNILQQVDELQQIASEFSIYSRIPRLDARRGDVAATVAEVVESYRTASPPGIALAFHAPAGGVPARFDARLLRRAVRNLIENSLRASAARGEVEVRVEASDGGASVAVADRGPGVPPELLQRIFDPYFSTHDSGTGLGLPITRRIVEEHAGSIVARNRVGGGLEVVIMIPLE